MADTDTAAEAKADTSWGDADELDRASGRNVRMAVVAALRPHYPTSPVLQLERAAREAIACLGPERLSSDDLPPGLSRWAPPPSVRIAAAYAASDGTLPQDIEVTWDIPEGGGGPTAAAVALVVEALSRVAAGRGLAVIEQDSDRPDLFTAAAAADPPPAVWTKPARRWNDVADPPGD